MARQKLSAEEAEEYTRNIGQVAVGNYGLMEFAMHTLQVPKALGLTNDEWVQERLGGYVRISVEQRKTAVAELSGEQSEGGRYERSAKQVAEILGIGESTVQRDRDEAEAARQLSEGSRPKALDEGQLTEKKLTPNQQKAAVKRLVKKGLTTAQIAVELGISAGSVSNHRSAIKREAEGGPSEELKELQEEKREDESGESKATKKGKAAASEEFVEETTQAIAGAMGLSPYAGLLTAEEAMDQVDEIGHEIQNYDQCVQVYLRLGHKLWEYGAIRGLDVSKISEAMGRFDDEKDD